MAKSVNPSTGEVLGRWADGGEAEARAAVVAARSAFDTSLWPRDRNLRNRALLEMADTMWQERLPFDPRKSEKTFSLLLTDVGMVRFLQQAEMGWGNYTEERYQWLGEPDLEELANKIQTHHPDREHLTNKD